MSDAPSAFAIYCDDIRTEDNGKMLIIGAYQSDIILNDPQGAFSLMVYLVIDNISPGEHDLEIRVTQTFDDDAEPVDILKGTLKMTVESDVSISRACVTPPKMSAQACGGGRLSMSMNIDGDAVPITGGDLIVRHQSIV